jgi:hypothetical protein
MASGQPHAILHLVPHSGTRQCQCQLTHIRQHADGVPSVTAHPVAVASEARRGAAPLRGAHALPCGSVCRACDPQLLGAPPSEQLSASRRAPAQTVSPLHVSLALWVLPGAMLLDTSPTFAVSVCSQQCRILVVHVLSAQTEHAPLDVHARQPGNTQCDCICMCARDTADGIHCRLRSGRRAYLCRAYLRILRVHCDARGLIIDVHVRLAHDNLPGHFLSRD